VLSGAVGLTFAKDLSLKQPLLLRRRLCVCDACIFRNQANPWLFLRHQRGFFAPFYHFLVLGALGVYLDHIFEENLLDNDSYL